MRYHLTEAERRALHRHYFALTKRDRRFKRADRVAAADSLVRRLSAAAAVGDADAIRAIFAMLYPSLAPPTAGATLAQLERAPGR